MTLSNTYMSGDRVMGVVSVAGEGRVRVAVVQDDDESFVGLERQDTGREVRVATVREWSERAVLQACAAARMLEYQIALGLV